MVKKTYNTATLKQLVEQTGIPYSHLRIIKAQTKGIFGANNSGNIDKVKEYYKEHKDEIIQMELDSKEALQKEKLRKGIEKDKRDIVLKDLEIAESQRQLIPVEDVKSFLQKLGINWSSLLLAKLVRELPSKIERVEAHKREELCKEMYNDICLIVKKDIESWKC